MVHLTLTERGIAFCTIGEMDGHRSLKRARVKHSNGQSVANAHEVADIDQGIDAGNIAFFGQTAQESLSSTAVLCWFYSKATQGTAPRSQRGNLAQRCVPDTL